jgi:hypothetical protein
MGGSLVECYKSSDGGCSLTCKKDYKKVSIFKIMMINIVLICEKKICVILIGVYIFQVHFFFFFF